MSKAICLALTAALVAACAKKEEPKTAVLPVAKMAPAKNVAAIASLVPTDATALVRISSVENWEGIASRLRADASTSLPDALGMLTGLLGLESSAVERGRPLFLCINLQPGMAPPLLTLIAPVKDPGAIPNAAATANGYVALSQLPEYEAGGSPLPGKLLDGDLSARCDLAKVVTVYRPMIDMTLNGLEQVMAVAAAQSGAGGEGFGDVAAGISEWAQGIVDSAGTLDMVVNHDDGVFDLQLASTPKKGSKAGEVRARSRLVEISRYLPQDMPVTFLARFDAAALNRLFMPIVSAMAEALPVEERKAMEDYANRINEIGKLLSDNWAMAMDFGKHGFSFALVGTSSDAQAYVTAYQELVTSPALESMGMAFTSGAPRKVAGTQVYSLRMSIDAKTYAEFAGGQAAGMEPAMAAMFGKDGLALELAAKDNLIFIATGKLMDGMLEADKPAAWLERAAREIGGELSFLARVEMRGFMHGISELMEKMMPMMPAPTFPKGGDLPVLLYGTVDGRIYRAGATADIGKLSAFFRASKRAR